jgi:hypothetical protein
MKKSRASGSRRRGAGAFEHLRHAPHDVLPRPGILLCFQRAAMNAEESFAWAAGTATERRAASEIALLRGTRPAPDAFVTAGVIRGHCRDMVRGMRSSVAVFAYGAVAIAILVGCGTVASHPPPSGTSTADAGALEDVGAPDGASSAVGDASRSDALLDDAGTGVDGPPSAPREAGGDCDASFTARPDTGVPTCPPWAPSCTPGFMCLYEGCDPCVCNPDGKTWACGGIACPPPCPPLPS